ncbi:MAG: hypothetical protein AABZ15_15220 [Nitrospirota bacterium]
MKKIAILAVALLAAAGCVAVKVKEVAITLTVDPPDAQIEVIGQGDLPGKSYSSPATIPMPEDHAMAAQSRVVISHKNYKTTVLQLGSVQGNSVRIRLQKTSPYRLKYSLVGPVRSADLTFRDKILAVTIAPRDQHIDLKIENLTQKPLTILWDSADYTDVSYKSHRVIPSSIKMENRGGQVPPQTIPVGGSLQVSVTPVDSISYAGEKKGYVVKPLFVLDDDSALSLKDKTVNIYLPVAIDGAIIPNYIFKIKIDDVIKDQAP